MAHQQTPSMASIPTKKEKHRSHKRKKTERNGTLTLDGLKTLGHQLLTSRAHINNLPVLLSFISPSASLDFALESLISIQSFFTPIVPELPSSSVKSGDGEKDPEAVCWAWLRTMFDEFVNSLIAVSVSPQSAEALRDIAMETIMDFVKAGKNGKFLTAIYHRFLHSIVHATSPDNYLLDSLASKYFNYIDVRFFTYTSMVKIAKTCDSSKTTETENSSMHDELQPSNSRIEDNIRIIYNILSHMPPLESADKERSYEMWSQSGLSMDQISRRLKLKFTKAWLSFLKSPLPLDVYKEVLVALHKKVIPHMANPAILCDFLTRSYDIGGVISVMALSGLFILMTQYGLEYPNFYEKLYALLTPAVFMAKHRAVFFQLLDTCLKSSYLPAYLAAAFAKKLSRLALSVPPSGALVIIAVIYNLLRRHPSINFLVHQEVDNEINADDSLEENVQSKDEKESNDGSGLHIKKPSFDPFDDEESNPAESGAMRSSLWEMDTLRNHYCPAVSRFVASMENDLTNRAKTSEVKVADFSSGSYATIFGDEMRRRIKQVPLAFYKVAPTSLFWESDFAGWTFGDLKNYGETIVQENGVVNNIENDDHEHVKRQCIERP